MQRQNPDSKRTFQSHEFSRWCERYADLAAMTGIEVRPYRSIDLPLFSRLSTAEQEAVLNTIEGNVKLFESMVHEKVKLTDSKQLLWRSCRALRLTPRSDIFDQIGDEDVVEIYSTQQKQIFRNLQFFKYVSLTLEDLYCDTWYDLTRRDPVREAELGQAALKLLSGEVEDSLPIEVPEHLVHEIDTEKMLTISIRVKWLSPVTNEGQLAGVLVINESRLVGPQA